MADGELPVELITAFFICFPTVTAENIRKFYSPRISGEGCGGTVAFYKKLRKNFDNKKSHCKSFAQLF